MIIVEVVACLAGFATMVVASQRAVSSASELAAGAQISPFLIGFTLLALGTDLPEMANSIASSLSGHGDVNIGDSVGSATTQVTLVLGLLLLTMGPLKMPDTSIAFTGALTVVALGVLIVWLGDGHFSRLEALLSFMLWFGGSVAIYRRSSDHHQLTLPEAAVSRGPHIARLAGAFVGLGFAATLSLWAIVALAERFHVPEFLVGLFVASIGTSLPELVFDVTAIRRGSVALAIGDAIGSSFIDATGSVSIGPLIAPTDVTTDQVVRGTATSLVAIAFVTFVLSRLKEHDWRTGVILLFTYLAFSVTVLWGQL